MATYFPSNVRQYFNIIHLWGVGFGKLSQDCQRKGFCHWVLFCQVSQGRFFFALKLFRYVFFFFLQYSYTTHHRGVTRTILKLPRVFKADILTLGRAAVVGLDWFWLHEWPSLNGSLHSLQKFSWKKHIRELTHDWRYFYRRPLF